MRGDSDLDISISIRFPAEFGLEKICNLESSYVKDLHRKLYKCERYKVCPYFTASFGLLLKLKDRISGLDIDISVNKVLDIFNSELLQLYARFDSRFHKLALVLKKLNKLHFSDKKTRLNSYSITLMLIAFLQHRKVLPSLQLINRPVDIRPYTVRYTRF